MIWKIVCLRTVHADESERIHSLSSRLRANQMLGLMRCANHVIDKPCLCTHLLVNQIRYLAVGMLGQYLQKHEQALLMHVGCSGAGSPKAQLIL